MAHILANGVRLYYEESGSGTPILVIHGTASSALVWGDALDPLTRLGRVIAYDRRGNTRSERPHPYDLTSVHEHAEDAAALLEALHAAPAVVIGRSFGGETALDLALHHPDQVSALVLLEPAALALASSAAGFAGPLTERVLAAGSEDPRTVAETFLRAVAGDEAWEAFPPPLKEMFTENGPAIAAELRSGFLEVTPEMLRTIAVPTLVVSSEASPAPFREVCDVLVAAMPQASLYRASGGHLISPGIPPVVDFVSEVLKGTRSPAGSGAAG